MKYKNIREEELKNKVGKDWFKNFDTTEILGNIDFSVFPKQDNLFGRTPLLWAEAKTGEFDISKMFVQLILTIGKARTFDKTYPPAFLGVFDFSKIVFVEYINIQDIFYINDFNWNVTPSNHETKEFNIIKTRVESILKKCSYLFDFVNDEKELKTFIKNNIAKSSTSIKIKIDKNNFIPIYLRWIKIIKPIIDVNWNDLKEANILDSDFFLADLFVDDKGTQNIIDDLSVRDNLFVVFKDQGYKISKENIKQMFDANINIKIKETYQRFWQQYKRPPITEFQEYIIERRDLLVSQDIRERKGAFFTPRIWVELSQKYITDYLGENWQDEYYIWDCAAGTGNLLAGLNNKYNVFASTIDQADVNVMIERIDHGANILKSHVFQFDFLNDDLSKLPMNLKEIINDENKRKRLVIYINPPYAEADNRKGDGRKGVAKTEIHKKYSNEMGYAKREMYIQFITRIYNELPDVIIANFSTLKIIQAPKFSNYRNFFKARLEKLFITPAKTFDNVKGEFPIGFFIWNTTKSESFKLIKADIYDNKGDFIGMKNIWSYDDNKLINDWVKTFRYSKSDSIATIIGVGSDFQNQRLVRFGEPHMKVPASNHNWQITKDNIIESSIYYTVRRVITNDWLNDRDQFLFPKDNWRYDKSFHNDCLTHTLFSNNFSSSFGINNWIPFSEIEIDAKEKFESNFMIDFIDGKLEYSNNDENTFFDECYSKEIYNNNPRKFSDESLAVFNSGRELWKYYHNQENCNVNASLYDIRLYFQGKNDRQRMNPSSVDEKYNLLIKDLRKNLKYLEDKIIPKIYTYSFLKEEFTLE